MPWSFSSLHKQSVVLLFSYSCLLDFLNWCYFLPFPLKPLSGKKVKHWLFLVRVKDSDSSYLFFLTTDPSLHLPPICNPGDWNLSGQEGPAHVLGAEWLLTVPISLCLALGARAPGVFTSSVCESTVRELLSCRILPECFESTTQSWHSCRVVLLPFLQLRTLRHREVK